MALYIPQSILHLARSLYVRPETYGPNYVYVAVKNIQLLTAAMKIQDFVPFAWLSSYKIFHTASNNINILWSPCKYLILSFDFNQIWSSLTDHCKRKPISNFTKIFPVGTTLIHAHRMKHICIFH